MQGSNTSQTQTSPTAIYRLPAAGTEPVLDPLLTRDPHEQLEPLLRQNAAWFCRLRWIVVGVLCTAGLAGFLPQSLRSIGLVIQPVWPLTAAAILTILNLGFIRIARQPVHKIRRVPVIVQLWAQIITDLLLLTAVIHWLGIGLPSAPYMYLFHVILACIAFPPGESMAVVALAAVLVVTLHLLESLGVIAPVTILASVDPNLAHPSGLPLVLHLSFMLCVWVVIWYLVSQLAGRLRTREYELAITNRRLEASSEERAEHMLQTTHQLKAPFAAIHAQTQLLTDGYCGDLPEAAQGVVRKIAGRCVALSRQIQGMLQLANLRSLGQTPLHKRNVDLTTLIEAAITRVQPAANQRHIRFETRLQSLEVHAVTDHLTMLLEELVANAAEYSYDRGVVSIECRPAQADKVVVVIRDQGIGIQAEKLPLVFGDYYRTDEAAQHNRMSTGLGLAIVRRVAQESGVEIEVESAPGWGTQFTVTIPGRITSIQPNPNPVQKD